MNNNPLVSIIIPTFNRETYLEEAIKSVVNQTYKSFEILVVDDGSKNNYAESICNKYVNCIYLYKKNGGLSSARNFGIQNAKGTYIAFLDDDDFWRNDKLEKQVTILDSQKNIDCVHSRAAVVDENSKETGVFIGASLKKAHKRSGYVFWNALGVWVIKSPTPLIRKTVFINGLWFDETIKVGEDLDFYYRMFYKHKIYYINEALAFYREYNDRERLSLQNKKYLGIEQKIYDNFVKMGILNPIEHYRIAKRLLLRAVKNYNKLYPKNKINLGFFEINLYPQKTLKKIKLT